MRLEAFAADYLNAKAMGIKEYSRNIAQGRQGNLTYLEGLLENVDILSEVDLGIVEIPLKKIKGTLTHTRSLSFAANFMPLLNLKTEFGDKWVALMESQVQEGIRDPIKVYEYLNWYYVVEGNKRVSVMKYIGAYSIAGRVTRLIPRYDENDAVIRTYYAFLEFYRETGISEIWFSRERGFSDLLSLLKSYTAPEKAFQNKYREFLSEVYNPFREIYHKAGGAGLSVTTGDALLQYAALYGLPGREKESEIRERLRLLMPELENPVRRENPNYTSSFSEGGVASVLASALLPRRKLKVAFAYAGTAAGSRWSHSHELGRLHLQEVFGGRVETGFRENIPEGPDAYLHLKNLAEEKYDVVFATSPAFIQASLRAALNFPEVKFFNCSEAHFYKHVNTYFGRMYEPRFLAGMVAGSMTREDILGYAATCPVPGVISGINAFTAGARMVNPRVRVKVLWTNDWGTQERMYTIGTELIRAGADIISHHNTMVDQGISGEYGVYSMVCNIDRTQCASAEYITAPVWNWGIFYEKILKSVLNGSLGTLSALLDPAARLSNCWWGMDSGVVDLFYSRQLVPRETLKLVELFKRMIISGSFHPFTGPIYDRDGILRIREDEVAGYEQITAMDWLAEGVEGELPPHGAPDRYAEPDIHMMETDGDVIAG